MWTLVVLLKQEFSFEPQKSRCKSRCPEMQNKIHAKRIHDHIHSIWDLTAIKLYWCERPTNTTTTKRVKNVAAKQKYDADAAADDGGCCGEPRQYKSVKWSEIESFTELILVSQIQRGNMSHPQDLTRLQIKDNTTVMVRWISVRQVHCQMTL